MPEQRRPGHDPADGAQLARRIRQSGRQRLVLSLLELIVAKWGTAEDHIHREESLSSDLPAVVEARHHTPPHTLP